MTGLIWFVQVVHYPMFALVGENHFAAYEKKHNQLTSYVVMPAMLTEMATASLLLLQNPGPKNPEDHARPAVVRLCRSSIRDTDMSGVVCCHSAQ